MRVRFKHIIRIFIAVFVTAQLAHGQSILKMADNHYDNLSFSRAIEAYEQALSSKNLSGDKAVQARIKLADSYCKIKDTQNAERVFRDLFSGNSDHGDASLFLKYAQVLASNGKYSESQEMYEKYNQRVMNDPRASAFSQLYQDVSVLSQNADCYNVSYLSINTTAADFSPAYHKNGLVFVSNRKSSVGVSRVFKWNETPFLDLFLLEDLSSLGSSTASLGGSTSTKSAGKKNKKVSFVGADEYTAPTANDSRTLGAYSGGTNAALGMGYGDKPQTESERLGGSINSKYHEGPAAFFKNGEQVIFTRNNFVNGKAEKSSDGINKLKLYIATASGDTWKDIQELPFNSNDYSTGHPSLNAEETLLFFASDMPGGFGGTDIYASRFENGNWSQPINLGPSVNTKGNEMFPFVDENGNLYFSSDGLPGLGGLDIFYARLSDTQVKGTPVNLGAPVNSSQDDFSLITDGERKSGYFSSNRKRAGDDDDIYSFERLCELKEGCNLNIFVFDAETKMPLDNALVTYSDASGAIQEATTNEEGIVKLSNLTQNDEFTFRVTRQGYSPNVVDFVTENCDEKGARLEIPLSIPPDALAALPDGETEAEPATCSAFGVVLSQGDHSPIEGAFVTITNACDGSKQTAYSDAQGKFKFMAASGCNYTFEATKATLASQDTEVKNLSCLNPDEPKATIYMFKTGDVVKIENIYFDYGKYNIRPDAAEGLDKLVKVLRDYPGMVIELGSHTDSRSPADFNQRLSDGRARESAEYLFKRGISRDRVTYKGYGESMITNGCVDGVPCTSAQHQANRRTEFRIVSMQ
jgi:outer membrane protein OmpA-like peptidoglycan-associated protein